MNGWESAIRERMRAFERASSANGPSVSIKVRAPVGCFHREHSPYAYELIDERVIPRAPSGVAIVEHESGPEILVALSLVTAGGQLLSSVIDLVRAIIEARGQGVRNGDHPSEPLEIVTRRFDDAGTLREEAVVRIGHDEPLDQAQLEKRLRAALERLADESD